ncbi:MAG: homoserine kinase [Chlorobium phaeobacteroides]|uniref:Homoserine kinase n=1 Tax=Chlorobium phaeobacteroides (strain BS1) TaxID=331678 RepID=KHSE_CHLPB|nr:RecName: Full=Homoserine kinase; Short=HK; Short=HSK [Chlorobium phaeobacteroides BS1]MBL6955276.1 homoserine kinase [Chlorobium phaeobacteroides]
MKTVTGFASATIGNVACGFDVLGFAITEPGDEVILTLREERSGELPVSITSITGDGGALPRNPKKNTSSFVVLKFLEYIRTNKGIDFEGHIELELKKNLPLSSGMGSSAASAAAALVAANELMGRPCNKMELVNFAIEGERVACGSAHADNAAPAMLGNFVLIRSYNPIDLITIPSPDNLYCTLVHPHIEVRTAYARSVLPRMISLKTATEQWGNVGALISGLLTSDYELIGRSLVDVIAEPKRAPLIPGFYDVKHAALEAGAIGCSIAGSGPSIFAFSSSPETASRVGEAMQTAFSTLKEKLQSDIWISPVCKQGAKVI